MIPVNYKQLGCRIGTSDRPLGEPTPNPEGFLVLDQTNGKVFKVEGCVLVHGGAFPGNILAAWYASAGVVGYRIETSDRDIGAVTQSPEGFFVLNTTNGKTFVVQGGVWADGGTELSP